MGLFGCDFKVMGLLDGIFRSWVFWMGFFRSLEGLLDGIFRSLEGLLDMIFRSWVFWM
jgi:hypothetical protein